MMPRIWWWVKISTLEVIAFSSLALTAQAGESAMTNLPSLATSPILISEHYGAQNSPQLELNGDNAYSQGVTAYRNQELPQASQYFSKAAYWYRQCYSEMQRQNDPRAEEVHEKYQNAMDAMASINQ